MSRNRDFWMMTYGDELLEALKNLPPSMKKVRYLRSYSRMGDYLQETGSVKDITFAEFFRLIDKQKS